MARKKSIWLSKKVEWIYYIIYIALSIYIRRNLFFIESISYFRILFPVIFGALTLFTGIKAIRERKVGLHSIMAKGKGTAFIGILLILGSLYFMFFVGV